MTPRQGKLPRAQNIGLDCASSILSSCEINSLTYSLNTLASQPLQTVPRLIDELHMYVHGMITKEAFAHWRLLVQDRCWTHGGYRWDVQLIQLIQLARASAFRETLSSFHEQEMPLKYLAIFRIASGKKIAIPGHGPDEGFKVVSLFQLGQNESWLSYCI